MNLFELGVEKYWDVPLPKKEQKKQLVNDAILSGKYMASEKMDGNWNRFVGFDGMAKMQTRTVSKVTGVLGEAQEKVPHIFKDLCSFCCIENGKETLIIGELYKIGGNDKDVGSILRCLPPKAVLRQKNEIDKLRYRIFDMWYFQGESLMGVPYVERVKKMREALAPLAKINPYIELSVFVKGDSIYNLISTVLADGGEGVVLQRMDGVPEPDKRPARKSIKIKKELVDDIDVFCIGWIPATREYNGQAKETWNYWENIKTGEISFANKYQEFINGEPYEAVSKGYANGWASSMEVGVWKNGELVKLCAVSGIKDELKEQLAKEFDKLRMKPMRVTGMEMTEDCSVRHPKFKGWRDDITDKDCTWEKIFGE